MSVTDPTHTGVQNALIFIPDISGFTRFVADVEISHSQHIIGELLDTLIGANETGLEVSEIEGDAILFYRFGEAPPAEALLAQVRRMFVDFHAHLRRYETHRICHCGACKSAHQLTLKFIAHFGPVSLNHIRQHTKLFGKDVIVAHRLLKNDIETHEYALFTTPLQKATGSWQKLPGLAWEQPQPGRQTYDSGQVDYTWLPLAPLFKEVPEPRLEDYSPGDATMKLFEVEDAVEAPLGMVFDVLSDVAFRNHWQEELDPNWVIDNINAHIPQHGITHRCISGGPTMISHGFKKRKDVIRFTETNKSDGSSKVFILRKIDAGHTSFRVVFFIKPSIAKKCVFELFLKKKMMASLKKSIHNIGVYCKSLQREGKQHPLQIVLEEAEER